MGNRQFKTPKAKKPQTKKPPDSFVEVSSIESGHVVWLKIKNPVEFEDGSVAICCPWRHAAQIADSLAVCALRASGLEAKN